MVFRGLWLFSLGFRPVFLPSWAYVRVCVFVAVFLSTETSLYASHVASVLLFHVILVSNRCLVVGLFLFFVLLVVGLEHPVFKRLALPLCRAP